jgi:uncharacterized protein (DUF427 family)
MTTVRLEPNQRLCVTLHGERIVDTTRAIAVYEGSMPARYYVHPEDVRAKVTKGQGASSCPWKGRWEHLDVTVGDKTVSNGAWRYFEPTPGCEAIRDHVAFYLEKMGSFEL